MTVTTAVADADPPGPVHDSTKLDVCVSAAVRDEPDVALLPVQLPEAAQLVAFVDDHVSVEVPFTPTTDGLALRLTVGSGGAAVTVTSAVLLTVPPAPLQVSSKL